ncbi:hypothetical protein [Yersinia enterocolitica]|nr:hypothetical protein [Yersinia enterocolitica]
MDLRCLRADANGGNGDGVRVVYAPPEPRYRKRQQHNWRAIRRN